MSEKPPGFSEQPPATEPTQEAEQENAEHAPATFEQAAEDLQKLKALGIQDPEFAEDERAKQFQETLADLDSASETLPDTERNEYPARRALLFFNAGFTDPYIIEDQLEFLQQNLANEEERGNTAEADRIRLIISKLEQLLPKEPEPEIPTPERIGEALRQPGRLPMEVHTMIMDWKSARLAEVGEGDPVAH